MTYEVLDSIDNIEDAILESSSSMIDSLFKTYEKSAIILENYQGDDLSSFSIFQEGEIMDNFKERGKGMSVLMKILSALPRFVMAVIDKIKKNSHKGIEKLEDTLNKMPEKNKKVLIALKYDNKNASLPRKIFGSILDWIKIIFSSLASAIGGGVMSLTALFVVIGYKSAKNKAIKDMITDDVDKAMCETLFKDKEIVKLVSDLRKKYGDDQKKLLNLINDVIKYWDTQMTVCKSICKSPEKYDIDTFSNLDILAEDVDGKNPEFSKIVINDSLVTCQEQIVETLKFKNNIRKNLEKETPVNFFYDESKDKHLWTDTKETMGLMLLNIRRLIKDIKIVDLEILHFKKVHAHEEDKDRYDKNKNVIKNIENAVKKIIKNVQSDEKFPSEKRTEFENNTETFLKFISELWNLVLKLETFNSEVVNTYIQLIKDVDDVNLKINKKADEIKRNMIEEKKKDSSTVKEYKKELKENKKMTIGEDKWGNIGFTYKDRK